MSNENTPRLRHTYYCTLCQEIVGTSPKKHRDEVHDGNLQADIAPLENKDSDGRWIAKPEGMGHFTPHVWVDVDGQEMCGECGAVRIAEDVIDQYVSTYQSTVCPECGKYAIRGTQEAGEHATETCECPNGHTWKRSLETDADRDE